MQSKKKNIFAGWGIFWKYLTLHKKDLWILVILGIFSALANGSVPYLMGKFFDGVLTSTDSTSFFSIPLPLWALFLLAWFLVQIIAIAADWTRARRQIKMADVIFVDYRSSSFQKLLLLPLAFHKEKKQGEFMESVAKAANSMDSMVSYIVIPLAPQFLSILIGMYFIFTMNTSLALVLSSGMLLYGFVLIRTVPQTVPLQRVVHKRWSSSWHEGVEAVNNISAVKAFGTEFFTGKKIKSTALSAHRVNILVENIWSSLNFFQRVIVVGTQLVIFILSIVLIHANMLTIGELIAFNGYSMMVFGPFVTLGQNWQTLQNGLIALERAERFLEEPQEVYEPKGAPKEFVCKGGIEFKNVSFSYKKYEHVLSGVSFVAKPGEVVALVGESGAGKSTLIDLISAYIFPKSGAVFIDGVSTKNLPLSKLRANIAIVPQEVVLFHDTVKKNIAYGSFDASDEEIADAARIAHADVFINTFSKKYNTQVGTRGVKLSVGQKQRIAIARAILRNPKILILDEPTSALDSETEKYVTEALDEVMKGRTTFVIAHRLSTVRRADKILVLEKGKIIEQGTHDELMAIEGGNYRRRYELHIGLV